MDTQAVIDALKALSLQYRSEATGKAAQADSIDLAVAQLEGTLKTQLIDAQKAIDTLTSALTDAGVDVPDVSASVAVLAP